MSHPHDAAQQKRAAEEKRVAEVASKATPPIVVHGILPRLSPEDPPCVQGHTAVAIHEKHQAHFHEKVVILGGILSPHRIQAPVHPPYGKYNHFCYCYDNAHMKWVLLDAKFAFPREGHTCVHHKSELIVHGGYGPGGTGKDILNDTRQSLRQRGVPCGFLRDTVVMDLHTLRFAELQTHGVVHHRSGHCAAVYGSEMFVLGGIGLEVHETQSVSTLQKDGQTERTTSYLIYEVVRGDFVKLDIPSRTWYSVPMEHIIRSDIPSPRWGHRMTRYGDGLYVFGGRDEHTVYADLHVFRIHNQQWQVVRVNSVEQPPARYYHQQLQWEDLLFVLGGSGLTEDVNFQSLLWCLDINSLFWSKISCAGAIPPSVSSGTMVALHNQARQRREVRSAQSFVEEHSFSAVTKSSSSVLDFRTTKVRQSTAKYRQRPTCDVHFMLFGGASKIGVPNPSPSSPVQSKDAILKPLTPSPCEALCMVQVMRPSDEDETAVMAPVSVRRWQGLEKICRTRFHRDPASLEGSQVPQLQISHQNTRSKMQVERAFYRMRHTTDIQKRVAIRDLVTKRYHAQGDIGSKSPKSLLSTHTKTESVIARRAGRST